MPTPLAITPLLRATRRLVNDNPQVVLVTNAVAADLTAVTFNLAAGDGAKLPQAGTLLESDDFGNASLATENVMVMTVDVDTLTVRRAINAAGGGNPLLAHDANTYWRISPRWSDNRLYDALQQVINTELWPNVWAPRETTLDFQGTNEYYAPQINDIEEVLYVYQLSGGRKWPLHFEFLSRELSDNTMFPGGALVIRATVDTSTIYVAYKAKPATPTNSDALNSLIPLGTACVLLEQEEVFHDAPSRGAVEAKITDLTKVRAGLFLRQSFEGAKTREAVRLMALSRPPSFNPASLTPGWVGSGYSGLGSGFMGQP